MNKDNKTTMEKVMNDPKYRGHHIIVAGGRVYKARTGDRASKILDKVRKLYPREIPEVTYLPDAEYIFI